MIKSNPIILLILVIVTLLGGFLRFYKLAENPVSLNTDEVTYGYSAYSILKTGKDEWGNFLPLTFKSVGDYKSPVAIYSLVPIIAIFGLNEFSERFLFALIGTLAIPTLYLISYRLTKNKLIAVITSGLLAISPWHIFYSRFGHDGPISMVIVVIGLLLFLNMIEKKSIKNAIFSAGFFVLSMYTYHSARFFVPALILLLAIVYFPSVKKNIKTSLIFLICTVIFVTPLFYSILFGSDFVRSKMVFISGDIEYIRYIALDDKSDPFSLIFFAIKRYINYFQPDYIFFNGLNMTRDGSLGLGLMYLFELPFLILGIWNLIKGKNQYKPLILGWILLSFLPASFTNNEQNPSRTIIALPMLMVINALGLTVLWNLLRKVQPAVLRYLAYFSYSSFSVIVFIHAFLVFAVHFPLDRGEYSFEGNKEAVLFAIENQDKYKEIVFDQFRGTTTPDIYALFDYYVLFYSRYDPAKFQKEVNDDTEGFGKYQFRKIYWPKDHAEADILFIGSPWSIPEKELKEGELLKKIYLSNGDLALIIAAPKPKRAFGVATFLKK